MKDSLEVREVRCDYPRDASAEMGLMSPGTERLLDIPEFQQVLSSYDRDSGTCSGGRRKGQYPCELLGGLSGFLSPSMSGPKTLCAVGAGT